MWSCHEGARTACSQPSLRSRQTSRPNLRCRMARLRARKWSLARHLDPGLADHAAPVGDLRAHESTELGRGPADRLSAEIGEGMLHFRLREGGVNGRIQAYDQFVRRSRL